MLPDAVCQCCHWARPQPPVFYSLGLTAAFAKERAAVFYISVQKKGTANLRFNSETQQLLVN